MLPEGTYDFKVEKGKNSTATTGYSRVEISEPGQGYVSRFYTQQIGKVANSNRPVLERTITISVDKETVVCFVPCWGTYAGVTSRPSTYLTEGKAIQVLAGSASMVDKTALQTVEIATVEEPSEEIETTP